MRQKGISSIAIIILIVILVLVIGGLIFIFSKNKTAKEKQGQPSSQDQKTSIVDCGEAGPQNPDKSVMNCIEEKFKECQPATVVISLGPDLIYYYEIIGPANNSCSTKGKFISNPNPEWIGKEMVCQLDNKKDFDEAVADLSKCEGDLYNLMVPKFIPANTTKTIDFAECANQRGVSTIAREDGTVCREGQIDLGSIPGITGNGRPAQCCK